MLSVILCTSIVQTVAIIALVGMMMTLRDDVRTLQQQVNIMTDASAQIRQDIATIRSKVAGIADAYTNAAAARLQKALDDQRAAIEAQSQSDLDAAHADAQAVIQALSANDPITPPATAADPSPAPLPSPADPVATNEVGPDGDSAGPQA